MVIRPKDGYGFVASDGTRELESGGTGLRMGRYRMAKGLDGYPRVDWNTVNLGYSDILCSDNLDLAIRFLCKTDFPYNLAISCLLRYIVNMSDPWWDIAITKTYFI